MAKGNARKYAFRSCILLTAINEKTIEIIKKIAEIEAEEYGLENNG